MTGNYSQSPRTAALLRAFHRESARGTVYHWCTASCVTMFKTFSEELGLESPDYSDYEYLNELAAWKKSLRAGGMCENHTKVLEAAGWQRYNPEKERVAPGDIIFFGHPTKKVVVNTTNYRTQFTTRPKAEVGAVVMPDVYAYWWTPLGILPIHPEWRQGGMLLRGLRVSPDVSRSVSHA